MTGPGRPLDPRRAAAEAVGTFFLVLIGTGAVMVDAGSGAIGPVGVALAFAFVVAAMVYAIGPVSGAHINPAVTFAFWSLGRIGGRDAAAYVAAQCAGAVAASVALRWILGPVGGLGATVPAIGTGPAFAVEFLLSFALMFVIAAVALDARTAPGAAGLAIGLAVGFDAIVGGPLTGASMNPARSLGPAVVGGIWQAHWLYWAAPAAGMLVAARAWRLISGVDAEVVPREALGAPSAG